MIASDIQSICRAAAERASSAKTPLATRSSSDRAALLRDMARRLRADSQSILDANALDMSAAVHLDTALRDRLLLDPRRLDSMIVAVEQIADQPDVLGDVIESRPLESGIRLEKRRVPIGLILVVYESRPNVTSDAAALCLKSGNAAFLRGSSGAINSNKAIAEALRK
ncbi:MAG TPA: gamma-glutamyl-phosphate reductase, partial [Phycisphaerales bacterium]|nr:gamma-glutamyl-phosphate reductase [Phycisphaerales bacterium]